MIVSVIDNHGVYGKVVEAVQCFEGGRGLEIVIVNVRTTV
jgi:hypothetical protein